MWNSSFGDVEKEQSESEDHGTDVLGHNVQEIGIGEYNVGYGSLSWKISLHLKTGVRSSILFELPNLFTHFN